MNLTLSRNIILLLILCFSIGLGLRLYRLQDGIIFGYDQARDAYRARSILSEGKLKLLGPESDIPGIHHGVGYYYLMSLPYFISPDPTIATAFLAVLNALGIFLCFYAGCLFFNKHLYAFLSALLYTVSFEIIQYARWLSNPSLGILTVLITFIGLWKWIKGKPWGLFLALSSAALSLHFQFFLIYIFLIILFVYWIYRPMVNTKIILFSLLTVFIIDLSFIISEIKFGFQAIKAFSFYYSNQSAGYQSVSDFIIRYIDRFTSVIFHSLAPLNSVLALVLVVCIISYYFKSHWFRKRHSITGFLLLWLFSSSPLFVFSSGALNTEFSFVGVTTSLIFLLSWFLGNLLETKRNRFFVYALLVIIVVINIRFNIVHAKDGSYIFSVQRVMTYGLEKKLIDYTYREAHGEPFSICTVTNPLFVNTTWAYLYTYYGKSHYSYTPYWAGADQRYQLGSLPIDRVKPRLRYLIFEPHIGIPEHVPALFTRIEDFVSQKIDEKTFGDFRVEKRILLSEAEQRKKRNSNTLMYNQEYSDSNYLLYHCFN